MGKIRKAYLLAFHRATNYGAVLQLFALKTVLERYDLEVEVIDYTPKWMKVTLKNQRSLLSFIKRKVMNFTFKSFISKLDLTKENYSDLDNLRHSLPPADFYFVGSDQVWNEKIIKEDPTYFLPFAPDNSVKIGYAISMGNHFLSECLLRKVKSSILRFDFISGREQFVSDFVSDQHYNKKVPVLLDPTLLLKRNDYDEILLEKHYKEKFIAVYSCMRDDRLYEFARHLKMLTGLRLINLGYSFKGADKQEYLYGPINWINRIKHSTFFITNSFHGTAFAVIYSKVFFTVPTNIEAQLGKNARFIELLTSLNLADRLVYEKQDIDYLIDSSIEYDKAHGLLEKRRKEAILFLETALL